MELIVAEQSGGSRFPLVPGPWRLERSGSAWRIFSLDAAGDPAIAIADLVHSNAATAALIAAAPRMLDALLRWNRAGASVPPDVQHEARQIIDDIERASETCDGLADLAAPATDSVSQTQ